MVITLTGENTFGRQAQLDKFVADFLAGHDAIALERVDGQEAEYGRIREAITSLPFLSDKKLVVLRAPGTNKQFAETVEQILDDAPDTTDVIIVEPKLDKRLAYYKFLKAKTDFREYIELDHHGLARWLCASAKEQGGTVSLSDAQYLVERVGLGQQLLSNELHKLLLYDTNVTRQTIDLLTDATPQSTIFQLLETAFSGNKRQTLGLYAEQRALKVEPAQIIAMLAWQLHVLAIIKTAGERAPEVIANDARLNPFVVRKSASIARRLKLERLKGLIADLLLIDIKVKSSGIDADEALQHYLLGLGE